MTDPKPAPAPAPRIAAAPAPAPTPKPTPVPLHAPVTQQVGMNTALEEGLAPRPAPPATSAAAPVLPDLQPLVDAPVLEGRAKRIPSHLHAPPTVPEVEVEPTTPLPPQPALPEIDDIESTTAHDFSDQGEEKFQLSDLEPEGNSALEESPQTPKSRMPFGKRPWASRSRSNRAGAEDTTADLLSETRPARKSPLALVNLKFPRKPPQAGDGVARRPAQLLRTPAGRAGLLALGGALVLLPTSLLLHHKQEPLPPVIGAPPVGMPETSTLPPVVPATPTSSTPQVKRPMDAAMNTATPKPNAAPTSTTKTASSTPNISPNKAAPIKTVGSADKTAEKSADPATQEDVRQALVTPDPALAGTFKPQNGSAASAQAGNVLPTQIKTVAPDTANSQTVQPAITASVKVRPAVVTPQSAPIPRPGAVTTSQITYAPPRYIAPPTGTAQPVSISAPSTVRALPAAVSNTVTLSKPIELDARGPVNTATSGPSPVVVSTSGSSGTPASAVVVSPPVTEPAVSYLGYAKGEGGNVAVVTAGGTTDSVMVGGVIAGAQVTEITPSHITLKDKGGSHQIPLEVNQ